MPPYRNKMASIDTVPVQLRESLRQANVDNLIEYLASKPEVRLGKNEQRGEPDLTTAERRDILRTKFESNPMMFLSTFGRFLSPSHLDCFSSMRKESYEINYYLTQLESSLTPEGRKRVSKNRRYEALQKLVDTIDYFTEEEMQRRNPILYEQLIGKYHTEEEREAFLFQSASTSSATGNKSDPSYDSNSKPTPLSDMLIAHMSRVDGECSSRRIDQESQINEENQADDECADDDEDMEQDNYSSRQNIQNHQREEGDIEEIEDNEKELLKEEFFTTMYRHFLEGKDEDIDYATIDENPEYDCGETFDQDEEEKYFDSEDAEGVAYEVDTLDNKEFRSRKDQEDKPESVEEDASQNSCDGDGEDALDAYMKTIDSELNKQQ